MRQKKNEPIVIPIEFKVACSLFKMDTAEVLQVFIDHVMVYDIINKNLSWGIFRGLPLPDFLLQKKEKTPYRKYRNEEVP